MHNERKQMAVRGLGYPMGRP